MLDNQINLESWLDGGDVKRFHQWPMVYRQQTVGEHTFNMLLISSHLYLGNLPDFHASEDESRYFLEMLSLQQAILFHDLSEGRKGVSDISGWAKRHYPDLKKSIKLAESEAENRLGMSKFLNITNASKHRLKVCDKLELQWTILQQGFLGNSVLFDATWPVVTGWLEEMFPNMSSSERSLYSDWRKIGDRY